jgi:hypothetical protein
VSNHLPSCLPPVLSPVVESFVRLLADPAADGFPCDSSSVRPIILRGSPEVLLGIVSALPVFPLILCECHLGVLRIVGVCDS